MPLRARRISGRLRVTRRNHQKNALNGRIIKNLLECRISLGLGDVLISLVEGLAQIVGAMLRISKLRVFLGHHEEKKSVVFHGAILHHRANALIALKYARIDFERLARLTAGLTLPATIRLTANGHKPRKRYSVEII